MLKSRNVIIQALPAGFSLHAVWQFIGEGWGLRTRTLIMSVLKDFEDYIRDQWTHKKKISVRVFFSYKGTSWMRPYQSVHQVVSRQCMSVFISTVGG